jgi:predicted nucleic acid-binding protein
MRVLLDTNILTRSFQDRHEQHATAVEAVAVLRARGDELFVVPQVLFEFWVVATRPLGENGFGSTPQEAAARLSELKRSFKLELDPPDLFAAWERLVAENEVSGKAAHDARLVASMEKAGLEAILTFNVRHFVRYRHVTVLAPEELRSS